MMRPLYDKLPEDEKKKVKQYITKVEMLLDELQENEKEALIEYLFG
mgnify:CR=1 FL=1